MYKLPSFLLLATFVASCCFAQFKDWKHSGSMYILTTPDGANLPASASVLNFPLLVRLHKDFFPFDQAAENGKDLRFASKGKALEYEIEEWDREEGTAAIWVKIPEIRGNQQQELRLYWGNASADNQSSSQNVFNGDNGYVGVWHMAERVEDATGQLTSKDNGTESTSGMIGRARHFPGGKGIFCGTEILTLPEGSSPHSTQIWFRPESNNLQLMGWGVEKGQGKVHVKYASPSMVRFDCYFSNGNAMAQIPGRSEDWTHAVHTYENGKSTLYINGQKLAEGNSGARAMNFPRPARLWIGGWYNRYSYIGDMDEVRVSKVARSAEWVRLEYENQKPNQTLVGHLVQPGKDFKISPSHLNIDENGTMKLTAQLDGARKVYWKEMRDGQETLLATDRFSIQYNPGRISGDQSFRIQLDALYPDGLRSKEVPVHVKDTLPDPKFLLKGPASWDGRSEIVVYPEILNQPALDAAGLPNPEYEWEVSGIATLNRQLPGKLILERAQNSGTLQVKLTLSNGGNFVTQSLKVAVKEDTCADSWVAYVPEEIEMPLEGQFYARDHTGKGMLYCRGKLSDEVDQVFLRVFANEKEFSSSTQKPGKDNSYHFAIPLNPGLIKYRVEFGTQSNQVEKILHSAGDIVCGDAYLIDGQSNALATDTRQVSPKETNQWVRSYGRPRHFKEGEMENLWCKPVWKAGREYIAELGWWGMELANRLVESQKVPIFIVNGAVGGTRIDQHQRNDENPTDLETIYGRMLWRVKEARLTHGIRAILWHQGENDQGAAGPDGGYGWETYQDYFVEMSADWKRDFPNLSRYYVFQIWPNACAMGGKDGNGDMLRERQRTLTYLYSNMSILSTLGIRPGGGCHYPLEGWGQLAKMVQPLMERDFYGLEPQHPLTAPNLLSATYGKNHSSIILEFDQPVLWDDDLNSQFYLNGVSGAISSGRVQGNSLILSLKESSPAQNITYLQERSWKLDNILMGKNGIAALTFCKVPIQPTQ